ncbi:MAG: hypothetical protein REI94_19785 [Moraxellaceae bacterium]|nr:hypothetical protein [Moraxellaceae bacterium]
MTADSQKDLLLAGITILDGALAPQGFAFQFRGEGAGSGGPFAWGEFVRGDRRLELHYRNALGKVAYHVQDKSAPHESYMRQLGVWADCEYPGTSIGSLQGFRGLAHDLAYAKDFLDGDAKVLLLAAESEAAAAAVQRERLAASYAGDARCIEEMNSLFKAKRYADVVAAFDTLHSPHLLSEAQRRLVQLARNRASG